MITPRLVAALGLAAAALAACSPTAPVHDKAFYAANPKDRASQLTACQADAGRLANTPNCVNAQAAEGDARTAHFYNVPKTTSRVSNPGQL